MFTAVTTCSTVASAVPETEPAVADTTASPFATERTSPDASTTATAVSPDAHMAVAPSTGWPLASTSSAPRRNLSPKAENSRVAGDTFTALTT
jgi:hypothetical protein